MSLTVTVIIPTFNRSHYLAESIQAVLNQTCQADRIVVIDDGSTDKTREIVAQYGQEISYMFQQNAGKSAALNNALRTVDSDTVWIIDDDDIVVIDALSRLKNALVTEPDAGFSYGKYDNFFLNSYGEKIVKAGSLRLPDEHDLYASLLISNTFIFQPAMLVRREAYQTAGPFDETLIRAQDYDMLLRLSRTSRGIAVNDIIFHQRQHDGERGSAAQRIDGARVWALQGQWDARVVEKNYQSSLLNDYLPHEAKAIDLATHSQVFARALMRRATSLARRGVWELALKDVVIIGKLRVESDAYRHEGSFLAPVWASIDWSQGSSQLSLFVTQVFGLDKSPTIVSLQHAILRSAARLVKQRSFLGDRRSAIRTIRFMIGSIGLVKFSAMSTLTLAMMAVRRK
ncbi:MAG: glycosyltransferase [Oxalobacteraceae bacterium]|nr:MAG: glycosyltransferase [Oxalobacteraceae bacterium]